VKVHIQKCANCKPYLGGYRSRKTGKEYHHASMQTRPKPIKDNGIVKYHRETQTVKSKNKFQQSTNDTATQMTTGGTYVANLTDKLIAPGKYLEADVYLENRLRKIITLQSYIRRWLAKNYVNMIRAQRDTRLEWERQEIERKKSEKEERIQRELQRRTNPRTKEDFDLLYCALEKWRQEEMSIINKNKTGAQRKAALAALLEQETHLIASIDQHKIIAEQNNRERNTRKFLDKAADAKRWISVDGKVTEMDTAYTIRAKQLRDLYTSIVMKYLTQEERLDVLMTLKHTVKEHDCKLTREIVELTDREADLLTRGVKEENLEGLRKRICTLFLEYVKNPEFNPEAARLLKVPTDSALLPNSIAFCPSCNQYKPSTEFVLTSNSRSVGKCRSCQKLDNDARMRQDLSLYRKMLRKIRQIEEVSDPLARIVFLLQESDLRYLVENIWNSKSALSSESDLYDMILTRWDKQQEWSPWNCILLSYDEAEAHLKLDSISESYSAPFIQKIHYKHVLARNHFSNLPKMAKSFSKKTVSKQSSRIVPKALPTIYPKSKKDKSISENTTLSGSSEVDVN
ncbi:uncharacterized protein TRIADDRAFT_25964, partial [Trichoplax adhaerens]